MFCLKHYTDVQVVKFNSNVQKQGGTTIREIQNNWKEIKFNGTFILISVIPVVYPPQTQTTRPNRQIPTPNFLTLNISISLLFIFPWVLIMAIFLFLIKYLYKINLLNNCIMTQYYTIALIKSDLSRKRWNKRRQTKKITFSLNY